MTPSATATGLLDTMIEAALEAGEAILDIYARPIAIRSKADGSPVTEADTRAQVLIDRALAKTGLPVVGEENRPADTQAPAARYFLVDPLDGTKEFIKRNGEFTVNIALIEDHRPIAGVVLAPALGTLYAGDGDGAFMAEVAHGRAGPGAPIGVDRTGPVRIVASRSHGHPALPALFEQFEVTEDVSVGSSLKFCLLASGRARLYPRLGPTCEWDTGAGQAVLEAAGGTVLASNGQPLRYGTGRAGYLNPLFVAASDPALAARCAAAMRGLA